jgi:hypothetical protein
MKKLVFPPSTHHPSYQHFVANWRKFWTFFKKLSLINAKSILGCLSPTPNSEFFKKKNKEKKILGFWKKY